MGRRAEHVLRIALERRANGCLLEKHFAVGQDAGQDIVEVVCDAAGEPPDRFHFLGLTQPLLESRVLVLRALALGDVPGGTDKLVNLARSIHNRATYSLEILNGSIW